MRRVSDIVMKPSARGQIARNPAGNEDFLQIALIELPSHGRGPVSLNARCILGRLADTKERLVTAPAPVRLSESKVGSLWEGKAPSFDAIVHSLEAGQEIARNVSFVSRDCSFYSLCLRKEVRTMIELSDDW